MGTYKNKATTPGTYNYNIKVSDGCRGCTIRWNDSKAKQCSRCKRCADCCLDITRERSCANKQGAVIKTIEIMEDIDIGITIAHKNTEPLEDTVQEALKEGLERIEYSKALFENIAIRMLGINLSEKDNIDHIGSVEEWIKLRNKRNSTS